MIGGHARNKRSRLILESPNGHSGSGRGMALWTTGNETRLFRPCLAAQRYSLRWPWLRRGEMECIGKSRNRDRAPMSGGPVLCGAGRFEEEVEGLVSLPFVVAEEKITNLDDDSMTARLPIGHLRSMPAAPRDPVTGPRSLIFLCCSPLPRSELSGAKRRIERLNKCRPAAIRMLGRPGKILVHDIAETELSVQVGKSYRATLAWMSESSCMRSERRKDRAGRGRRVGLGEHESQTKPRWDRKYRIRTG